MKSSGKIFKITFVDDEVDGSFYSGGSNFIYKMVGKQYKHSQEGTIFDTPDDEINALNELINLTNDTTEFDNNNEIDIIDYDEDDMNNPFD